MRVLVTGAGGYVGRSVVESLLVAGHEPVAMVQRDAQRLWDGVEVRAADLRDPESLRVAVAGMDAVCHLAGLTRARESWGRPLDYFAVNVGGTVEMLRAMETAGVGRIVFASTATIYATPEQQPMSEDLPEAPPHPYASSKVAAEAVLRWEARRRGLRSAVLRLFNAAGRSDPDPTRSVPRVLGAAAGATGPFGVNGDGSVVRDYLHVDDAGDAFVAALTHLPPAGEVRPFNIGSGTGVSITELIAAVQRVTGRAIPVVHNPPANEPIALVCDRSRAAVELEWEPCRSDLDTILCDAWSSYGARASAES